MHEPLNSRSSFLYNSTVFLDVFPVGIQSQLFWGLVSPVQDSMAEVPNVEFQSFTALAKDRGVPCLGVFPSFVRPYLCLFYISICPLLWKLCSSSF